MGRRSDGLNTNLDGKEWKVTSLEVSTKGKRAPGEVKLG